MMFKKVIALVLLFSFIYQISYIFLPFNTPFVLGLIGMPIYIYKNFSFPSEDRAYVRDILLSLLPVVVVALFSIVGNLSTDFYFVKWAIINALYFFGAYLLILLLRNSFRSFSFGRLVELLVLCAVVQLSLSLIMYFSPTVNDVLLSFIQESAIAEDAIDRAETRMIGFGTHFFTSGTVHAFILIMIAVYFMQQKVSYLKSVVMMLSFVFVAAVGMMMARTTLVGVLFAIVIVLLMRKGKKFFIFGLVSSSIIMYILSTLYLDLIDDSMDVLFGFAFEAFVNYQETGSFSTSSTDGMLNLYKFPTTLETWLLGDARYEAGKGYYMNTDIGYCRLIFYFGIIGFIAYMYFEYYILKKIFPTRKYGYIIWSILLCFVLIINGKGTFDIFPYVCLFAFFLYPCSPRRKNIKDSFNIEHGKKNSNSF